MKRLFLLFVFSVIFISCSSSVPKYTPLKTHGEMLSNYNAFCNLMDTYYPYFDIVGFNWDSLKNVHRQKLLTITTEDGFVKNIRQMLSAFQDPHCNIVCPNDESLFSKLLFHNDDHSFSLIFENILNEYGSLPFRFTIVHNMALVSYIDSTSNEYKEGIRLGMPLEKVDGIPVDKYIEEKYIFAYRKDSRLSKLVNLDLIFGRPATKTLLGFIDDNGKAINVNCEYKSENNKYLFNHPALKYISNYKKMQTLEYGFINNDIGYISIPSFLGVSAPSKIGKLFFWTLDGKESPNVKDFENALNELSGTKGLILDIRNNLGGDASIGTVMAQYFVSEESPVYSFCFRDGSYPPDSLYKYTKPYTGYIFSLEREHRKKNYRLYNGQYLKPVVVLQNEGCLSSTEDFIATLKHIPTVTTLGVNSSGSSSYPQFRPLPNGMYARIPVRRTYWDKDKLIEKDGIPPDIIVKPSKNDVYLGKDIQLEKAIGLLNNKDSEIKQ
ncbi:MAG: S41 family peptidase [Bacillota bacterium]